MSTDWLPSQPIPFTKIKGIKTSEVWEVVTDETTERNACLTDGHNYLWAYENNGWTWFTRYGTNDADKILGALADKFNVKWYSEYDDEFKKLVENYNHITITFTKSPNYSPPYFS